MKSITIKFNHPKAEPPKYTFGLRVAITSSCQPKQWATGRITGLRLDDRSVNHWNYTVDLDSPQGYCEEYSQEDLVAENELLVRQQEWEETNTCNAV
jgi:hypothetical protein